MNGYKLVMLIMYHCTTLLNNCEIKDRSVVAFIEYMRRNLENLIDKEIELKIQPHLLFGISMEVRRILQNTLRLGKYVNNLRAKNKEKRIDFIEEVTEKELTGGTF